MRYLTSERNAPRDVMIWNKVHYILYRFKIFTKLKQVLLLIIMIVVVWLLQCMVQMPSSGLYPHIDGSGNRGSKFVFSQSSIYETLGTS
jgi:hypothetical protein